MTAFVGNDSASQEREVRKMVEGIRSPEVDAKVPEVEAMALEDRIKLVDLLHANLTSVITGWKKFGPLLVARGMTKEEVRDDLKRKKRAAGYLAQSKRLVQRRFVFGPFRERGERYFNTFVAWLMVHEDLLVDVLGTGSVKGSAERLETLADRTIIESKEGGAAAGGNAVMDNDNLPAEPVTDVAMDGPRDARTIADEEVVDLVRDDSR